MYVCCYSHCSEHPWRLRSEVFIPDKRSIFAVTAAKPDDQEAAQQSADDDDDDASDAAAAAAVSDECEQNPCSLQCDDDAAGRVHQLNLCHDAPDNDSYPPLRLVVGNSQST